MILSLGDLSRYRHSSAEFAEWKSGWAHNWHHQVFLQSIPPWENLPESAAPSFSHGRNVYFSLISFSQLAVLPLFTEHSMGFLQFVNLCVDYNFLRVHNDHILIWDLSCTSFYILWLEILICFQWGACVGCKSWIHVVLLWQEVDLITKIP